MSLFFDHLLYFADGRLLYFFPVVEPKKKNERYGKDLQISNLLLKRGLSFLSGPFCQGPGWYLYFLHRCLTYCILSSRASIAASAQRIPDCKKFLYSSRKHELLHCHNRKNPETILKPFNM